MLSLRLWRTLADVDAHNPIFRRSSQKQKPPPRPTRPARRPRLLWLLALLALLGALFKTPPLLAFIFAIPILLITAIVLAPLWLPGAVLLAGGLVVAAVVEGIYREKRQYTYDLICAAPPGAFEASWFFAAGILHRGGWFGPLRWGLRMSLRLGKIALAGLLALMLWLALAQQQAIGASQLRLLTLGGLLLLAYYGQVTQTFVLSLVIGLFCSSFDWVKRDASMVGLGLYCLLSGLPLALAGLVLVVFGRVALTPLAVLAVESLALLALLGIREALIGLLWWALRRRLNVREALGVAV